MTVDLGTGNIDLHDGEREDWRVSLIDTGQPTRDRRADQAAGPCSRQRDVHADLGRRRLSTSTSTSCCAFHRSHGKLATLTAVRPPARFGHLEMDGERIVEFSEKPQTGEGWINGAFFVLEPAVFDYIDGDDTQLEHEPLERLAKDGQLMAYRHYRVLAVHGHDSRPASSSRSCGMSGEAPWKVVGGPDAHPRHRASTATSVSR